MLLFKRFSLCNFGMILMGKLVEKGINFSTKSARTVTCFYLKNTHLSLLGGFLLASQNTQAYNLQTYNTFGHAA